MNVVRGIWANKRGNIAVMTAMLMMPLVGAAGGAIDIGRLEMIHSRLQDAADAASVGSVAATSAAMKAAASMNGDGPINAGTQAATSLFNADMTAISNVTVSSTTVAVTKTGRTITSTVSVAATTPSYFLGIFGLPTLHTSAKSVSVNSLPTFIDFYLLLDNTPSMGVGATPNDVATMVANTPDQCAFACHDVSNPAGNYYQLAKNLGVTTRIDVLRSATQQLVSTAQSTETVPNQFRMGVYTFGASSAAPGFFTISNPNANLTTVKAQASAIDLMSVPYQNYNSDQDTDFAGALTGANSTMPYPGTGVSASSRQEILFIVSDGVNDSSIAGVRTIQPIDPSYCTAIKNRGIQIAVLYTTYLPLPTNAFYNSYVDPFVSSINPTMQSCASPGLFFEVSPTQGIAQAMIALFQKAVANAHIAQ
jgi:Flp pilus assembly protein TadG